MGGMADGRGGGLLGVKAMERELATTTHTHHTYNKRTVGIFDFPFHFCNICIYMLNMRFQRYMYICAYITQMKRKIKNPNRAFVQIYL